MKKRFYVIQSSSSEINTELSYNVDKAREIAEEMKIRVDSENLDDEKREILILEANEEVNTGEENEDSINSPFYEEDGQLNYEDNMEFIISLEDMEIVDKLKF